MSPSQNASTMKFNISGMTCGHCISTVTNAIKSVNGVTDALVELPDSATVTWQTDPEPSQIEQLESSVKAAGYSAAPVDQPEIAIEKPVEPVQNFPKLTSDSRYNRKQRISKTTGDFGFTKFDSISGIESGANANTDFSRLREITIDGIVGILCDWNALRQLRRSG